MVDRTLTAGHPVEALQLMLVAAVRSRVPRRTSSRVTSAAWTPVGFPQQHSGRVARVPVEQLGRWRRVRRLRRCQAVVIDGSTASDAADGELLAALSTGLPAIVEPQVSHPGSHESEILGAPVGLRPDDLADVRVRELHSVRMRRIAIRLRRERRPPPGAPSVSVVLATRRPADLFEAVGMIVQQQCRPHEVLVGLHGDEFGADVTRRLQRLGVPGLSVHAYTDEASLGRVLDDLTRRSTAELVTKWDDDDWYGCHHIGDLVDALDYSGADLVGKAAEFVHLEDLGVTVRRMSVGAETYSTSLAGGTLLARRDTILSVGSWPDLPRHVDRGLIDRMLAHGNSVYRTHGFEYVLRRRAAAHTWSASSSYFVAQSIDQRTGLDLDFAGFSTA